MESFEFVVDVCDCIGNGATRALGVRESAYKIGADDLDESNLECTACRNIIFSYDYDLGCLSQYATRVVRCCYLRLRP
jgi:hypothetical protein